MNPPSASGLDGIVVAETSLSDVDGELVSRLIRPGSKYVGPSPNILSAARADEAKAK